MVYIYVLEKNNIPFYVGKTINLNHRLWEHKKKRNADDGFVIDEVNENEWKFWEKHYISLFKSWGFDLENKNNGGGGPSKGAGKGIPIHSETQKQKWSFERRGKTSPNKGKNKKHTKGYTYSKSKPHSNKGISLKEEHRLKCAENKQKEVIIYKNNVLIKECKSIKDTADFIGCSKGNVSLNLKGKTKSCKGYILKYK